MNLDRITEKKKKLDKLRPLPKELVHNLNEWFKIELTYTSNAIEGNTLTRRETALVVEKGLTVGGKSLKDHLEATNHAKALDWVMTQVSKSTKEILEKDILKIHELILIGIDSDSAGLYRNIPVRISGPTTVLPNPIKVPSLMESFTKEIIASKLHPVELAAFAHYKLVAIHPFIDGNGRTARLLMNMILIQSGYPPSIINNEDREAYIKALEKADSTNNLAEFNNIIVTSVEKSLDIYLNSLKNTIPKK